MIRRGFLLTLIYLGCCLIPCALRGETIAAINGATGNTITAWLDVSGYQIIQVQAFSTNGSGAIVDVEASSDPTAAINGLAAPPYLLWTTTNPNASRGDYGNVPRAHFIRINLNTYSSGTIYVNIDRYVK